MVLNFPVCRRSNVKFLSDRLYLYSLGRQSVRLCTLGFSCAYSYRGGSGLCHPSGNGQRPCEAIHNSFKPFPTEVERLWAPADSERIRSTVSLSENAARWFSARQR